MAEDWSLVRGLVRDWKPTDVGIAEHEAKPDPHPQYALEVDAIAAFAFAAYGGIQYEGAEYSMANLGAGWVDLDMLQTASGPNRHIVLDLVNSTLEMDFEGVYLLTASLAIGHNSSNSGRTLRARLYNHTDGNALGDGFQMGTGRNAVVTSASISLLFEITSANLADAIGLQIGGGDSYTSVELSAASYSIHSIGEFRGQLGEA